MNTDWHDLIQHYIAGLTTDEETALLLDVLKRDDAVARLYLRYMNLDVALEAHAGSQSAVTEMLVSQPQREAMRWAGWLTWRPLTAAAAGIVFGMFCTSVVFGFVVQRGSERKTPLAVAQPSFEDPQMPLVKGFPDASAHWGGDEARVVAAENGVKAKEGKFMLRLEVSPKGSPRVVYQVLDLQSLPLNPDSKMREFEIEASFAGADADASERYIIRAFAVSEAREKLDATWFDRRDEAIASATRGLDVMPGSKDWQTFGLKIQVPRTARSLVLLFGVRTPDKAYAKTAHYLDDVQVSLIEPQPLPLIILETNQHATSMKYFFLAASIAALILADTPMAQAATALWNGGGADTNWTSANWTGGAGAGGAAAANDTLSFGGTGGTQGLVSNNNFADGTVFASFLFTNTGILNNSAGFTLGSTSSASVSTGTITSSSIAGSGTVVSSMTDFINLNLSGNTNLTVTTGTAHNLTISGIVSGSRSLTKTGTGSTSALTLTSSANSFNGAVNINTGVINIDTTVGIADSGSNSALGAGSTIKMGNGSSTTTLNFLAGAASSNRQFTIGSTTVTAPGGAIINNNTANGSGTLVLSGTAGFFNASAGAITIGRTITLGGANTDANTISGAIIDNNTSGGGTISVTKADAGKWIFSGANTYTGSTTVSAGTLAGIGASAFGNTSGISISGAGTLSLLGDSSTSFVKPTGGAAIAVSTSAAGATINVDRATVGGTGAKTMTIGALTTSSTSATWTLGLTGANNTSLSIGAVTGPASTSTGSPTVIFTNGITGGGKLTLASYTAANTGVGGNETVRFDGGINEITGAITPSAQLLSLRIAGGASLTLNAASTYTNGTTNSSGDLIIKNNTALGSGGVVLGVSGTTDSSDTVRLLIGTAGVNAANTIDMGGSTGTAGAAFSIGSTVDGNTTFSGAINVKKDSSITQVATTGANALSITGGISSAAARTITFAGPGAINVGTTGMADGAGALSVSVTGGTTTLSATNAYSGTTGVSAGTLSLTGSLTGGGAISTSGTGILNESAVGVISGASSVTQGSSGTSVLSGANTYSGGTTLSAGQLNINNAGSGGTSSAIGTGALTIAAGTTIDNTTNGAITLSTSNAVNLNGDFTYGGTRDLNLGTGAVALAATSNATPRIITLGGSGRTLTFGGTVSLSTNTGPRTFQVDGAGNTLVLGSLVLNADLTGSRISTFSGSGNITVNGTVTPGGNTANGLTYAGTGTLTLGGATSFTGNTAVSSGTLLVNSTSASTSVIASGSGTLGGTGTINGSVAVQTGGKITGGTDTNVGQLATGALTLSSSTSILSLQVSAVNTVAANGKGTTHDNLNVTGALTYGSGTLIVTDLGGAFDLSGQAGVYDLLDATSFSGNLAAVTVDSITLSRSGTLWSSSIFTFEQTTGILTVTAVPEPSTYIGGGLILGLAAWSQRRRFTFSTAQSSDGLVS